MNDISTHPLGANGPSSKRSAGFSAETEATLFDLLEMQFEHRRPWVDRFFANAQGRPDPEFEDIQGLSPEQAAAFRQLLLSQIMYCLKRNNRKPDIAALRDDGPTEWDVRLLLYRSALEELCQQYGLPSPNLRAERQNWGM